MKIKVITSSGVFELASVRGITLETVDGQRTFLTKHIDAVVALGVGKGSILEQMSKSDFVIAGGLATLRNNEMTIMPEVFSFLKSSDYVFSSGLESLGLYPKIQTILGVISNVS